VDQVMLTKVHLKYSTDSNSEQLKNGIIWLMTFFKFGNKKQDFLVAILFQSF
jgi:hypothetical protein